MDSRNLIAATNVLFILTACTFLNSNARSNRGASDEVVSKPAPDTPVYYEDFEKFYKRFNSDTVFQIKRVKFPLDGYQVDEMGKATWSKKNWVYHAATIYEITDPFYKTSINKEKTSVTDVVEAETGDFYFERRFELIKGKWFLVYCLDKSL